VGQQFALAQVAVGADMIGIGDAAASLVSPKFYAEHVAPREKALIKEIHAAGATARLHICGSVQGKFAALAGTGADIIDIDFPQSVADVRAAVGPDVCLTGNLHPVEVLVNGTPEDVRAACARCHAEAGSRYLLAAGCEIAPETPAANLAAFFDYAVTADGATPAR
jgi:uroporphyrinogen-III decarboxylase